MKNTINWLLAVCCGLIVIGCNSGSGTRISGQLTEIGFPVATETNPSAISISADGLNAYVTNYNSNTVSQYSRSSSGILTAIGIPVATGTLPLRIIVSSDGNFVYVTNQTDKTVSQYSRNAGILTALGTVATGTLPVGIIVSPDGKNTYLIPIILNNLSDKYNRVHLKHIGFADKGYLHIFISEKLNS